MNSESSFWRKLVIDLAGQTLSPDNYFNGRHPECTWELPNNLLVFTRKLASSLANINAQPKHWHHHHRFVFVFALNGSGTLSLDTQIVHIEEGDCILIFPFQFHSYHDIHPASICWTYATFELQNTIMLEELRSSPRKMGEKQLQLLYELLKGWSLGSRPESLQLLLSQILLPLLELPGKKTKAINLSCDSRFLQSINTLAIRSIGEQLRIKDIANRVGISESHLQRQFREITGISIGAHLRALRINHASSLLRQSTLSIGEVASRSGFESIYSFSRAFRDVTGRSPRAFRGEATS